MDRAEFYVSLGEGFIRCELCPRACRIAPGQKGACRARENLAGQLKLPYYGHVSSIAVDPIEKKPLCRFLPGTQTFSVGFWHCTMRCPFCQNWEIAQPRRAGGRFIEAEDLVAMAEASGLPSISFTYSEPCLHIEYVKKCMQSARRRGLKTILVTNGNLQKAPAEDILSLCDAANVDLKCYSEATYRDRLGGELEAVKYFIQKAYDICHVEVTSLLVPGILDTAEQIEGIASFVNSISRTIPLHITSYRPVFRFDLPPLSAAQARRAAAPAFGLLDFVYFYGGAAD